ncbi:MAG: RES family NAD+ phosphorylase [Gemmatimonadota bacterium]|nr:RES family NAD+ phosphorylase [Gemmatimonadota bacterium]
MELPTIPIEWTPAVRIASMRQTPEAAFERIADAAEAAAILEVIAAGRPPRVAPEAVAVGEGAGWIMAAFLRGGAGRFNDETFGAFYAAREEATAIAETRFHYARILRDAREEHTLFGARLLLADIVAAPVDIRSRASSLSEFYDPDPGRYGPAQRWAASQRAAGADGVLYDSVRRAGGQCVALFRPRLVRACRTGDRLAYEWDGAQFAAVYTLTPRELP